MSAAELAVLKDPARARPGAGNYVEGYEDVFSLFRLPRVLRQFVIDKANAYEDSDGRRLAIQAFVGKYDLTYVGSEGVAKSGALSSADWELVPVTIEEGGFVRLGRPALAVSQVNYDQVTFETSMVWARVPVQVTLTVRDRRLGPFHDTGVRGDLAPSVLSSEGLAHKFVNPAYRFAELGGAFTDEDGSVVEFGCRFWRESTGQWVTVAVGETETLRDDRGELAAICEAWLDQRSSWRRTATVWFPGLWNRAVGSQIVLENSDDDGIPLTVIGAVDTLVGGDYGTRLTAVSQTPSDIDLGTLSPGSVSGLGVNSRPADGSNYVAPDFTGIENGFLNRADVSPDILRQAREDEVNAMGAERREGIRAGRAETFMGSRTKAFLRGKMDENGWPT
jgi:hypothetical protein